MKTLLILHGWKSSKEKWQKVKELVSISGIKVIVPDLPGFKPENELKKPWSIDDYIYWLEDFIKEQELQNKFYLLGHSFGGRMAIKYAVKNPEKLNGLILVSGAGITLRPKTKIKFFAIVTKIGNLIFCLPILRLFRPLGKKFIYFLIGKKDYYSIQNQVMKETFKKVIRENLSHLLADINAKTLIIWGDKDKITPIEDAHIINKKIKNSKLEVLKNIDHTPYLENFKLLSQKIIEFINNA